MATVGQNIRGIFVVLLDSVIDRYANNLTMLWRGIRRPQRVGLQVGLVIGSIFGVYLLSNSGESLRVGGPMTIGHQDVSCKECHQQAPGTTRQQLQAKVQYWIANRKSDVSFGFKSISNEDCMSCHKRSYDRHPTYRFLEPRFAEARSAIAPDKCRSCHFEHTGDRVGVELDFCQNCHQETNFNNDPIDPSHADIVENGQWSSCIQCHDFHGNHEYKVPARYSDRFSLSRVRAYFRGGDSPYGEVKVSPASLSSLLRGEKQPESVSQ